MKRPSFINLLKVKYYSRNAEFTYEISEIFCSNICLLDTLKINQKIICTIHLSGCPRYSFFFLPPLHGIAAILFQQNNKSLPLATFTTVVGARTNSLGNFSISTQFSAFVSCVIVFKVKRNMNKLIFKLGNRAGIKIC